MIVPRNKSTDSNRGRTPGSGRIVDAAPSGLTSWEIGFESALIGQRYHFSGTVPRNFQNAFLGDLCVRNLFIGRKRA
jgi:hypothetical protein